jgi:hypothetical protein
VEEEEEEHLFVLCALYATRALCARDKTHALYLGKTQVYADIPILYTFPIYIYIYPEGGYWAGHSGPCSS